MSEDGVLMQGSRVQSISLGARLSDTISSWYDLTQQAYAVVESGIKRGAKASLLGAAVFLYTANPVGSSTLDSWLGTDAHPVSTSAERVTSGTAQASAKPESLDDKVLDISLVTSGPLPANCTRALVKGIVDGDTADVEIEGREERVRYLGIDTPEIAHGRRKAECYASEATKENERLVSGKYIILLRSGRDRDDYGRLLRFVLVPERGKLVNVSEALVGGGYSFVGVRGRKDRSKLRHYPEGAEYRPQLEKALGAALREGRGMWGGECKEEYESVVRKSTKS